MIRINKDRLFDPKTDPPNASRVGTTISYMPKYGIERAMDPREEFLSQKGQYIRFRLKDDDGEIYYEGQLTDDEDCQNQTAALRWGESDAGCTTIEVKRDGKWTQEIG